MGILLVDIDIGLDCILGLVMLMGKNYHKKSLDRICIRQVLLIRNFLLLCFPLYKRYYILMLVVD